MYGVCVHILVWGGAVINKSGAPIQIVSNFCSIICHKINGNSQQFLATSKLLFESSRLKLSYFSSISVWTVTSNSRTYSGHMMSFGAKASLGLVRVVSK